MNKRSIEAFEAYFNEADLAPIVEFQVRFIIFSTQKNEILNKSSSTLFWVLLCVVHDNGKSPLFTVLW